MSLRPDPGSFRDPAGRVYHDGDRIVRAISPQGIDDWRAVRDTGLLDRLAAQGSVIASDPIDAPADFDESHEYVAHPRLPFISYPYEWGFEALKAAALLHLDVHLEALAADVTLVDSSAYNIQFEGPRPIFIDVLSFRPYQEGGLWDGHRQFCEQFLYPLLLEAKVGVSPGAWYRGALEGITAADLRRVLPFRQRLSPRVWKHVIAPTMLANLARKMDQVEVGRDVAKPKLPKAVLEAMLRGLRGWIDQLALKDQVTVWGDYSSATSYADEGRVAKTALVGEFVAAVKPRMLWDIGCNAGEFSFVASDAGAAHVVGWDADTNAVSQAFIEARRRDAWLTPLLADLANPTPSQGWAQAERPGMAERGPADALLALALVHHLAIGRNIPVPGVVDWLVSLAPVGLVEFIPKTDPQIQRMLAFRNDIFAGYDRDAFVAAFTARARIERIVPVGESGREMIWYATA